MLRSMQLSVKIIKSHRVVQNNLFLLESNPYSESIYLAAYNMDIFAL